MKILLLLLLLAFSTSSLAKTVARVLEINGNAFVFYGKKDSKKLFYGDKIEDMSEVMVDDSSTVTLKDEYGRVFHLAGGTYAKIFNNLLEVKNGNIWVTSQKGNAYGVINSVNSIAKFTQGHFVYSFDNMSGKSQVLVLTGDVDFSNVVEPNLSIKVPAGHFSFVDQEKVNGLPREATRVGLTSYKQVKSLFTGIESLENTKFDKALFGKSVVTSRGIASVSSGSQNFAKKGKLLFVETEARRLPASVGSKKEDSAYEYYKTIKKSVSKKVKKTGKVAKVRLFGFDDNQEPKQIQKVKKTKQVKTVKKVPVKKPVEKVSKAPVPAKSNRAPASVEKVQLINEINARGAFEKSLQKANDENKRHPAEVNSLINELKSYSETYEEDY